MSRCPVWGYHYYLRKVQVPDRRLGGSPAVLATRVVRTRDDGDCRCAGRLECALTSGCSSDHLRPMQAEIGQPLAPATNGVVWKLLSTSYFEELLAITRKAILMLRVLASTKHCKTFLFPRDFGKLGDIGHNTLRFRRHSRPIQIDEFLDIAAKLGN